MLIEKQHVYFHIKDKAAFIEICSMNRKRRWFE